VKIAGCIFSLIFIFNLMGCFNPLADGMSGSQTSATFYPGLPSGKFPDHIEVVSGNNQTSLVGSLIQVDVKVVDLNNVVVPYVPLALTVLSGSGSVSSTIMTDILGYANVSWTLGPSIGSQSLRIAGTAFTGVSSVDVFAQAILGAPSMPVSLTATAVSNSATLNWSASAGATSYNILRGTVSGSLTQIGTASSTTYVDATVTNGVVYYYAVQAVNASGVSVSSSEISVQPIGAFTISSVAVSGSSTLQVNWNTATGASNYVVKYSTSNGGPYMTSGCTTSTTSCAVTGLTAGTTYYFMVTAANTVGAGTNINATLQASGVPLGAFAISSVTPSATDITTGTVALVFGSSSGSTSYSVKYGTSSGVYGTTVSTNATSPFTVAGLNAGTTYYFMITATNGSGSLNANAEVTQAPYRTFTLSIPFTTGTESSYVISDSSSIELTAGGVVRLKPASQTDDLNNSFGVASMTGVTWDGTNNYLRLNTTTNNSELDASWTPKWSNLVSYWKMENNWNDTLGTYHGTISGATYSSPGKIGNYHSVFNGSAFVSTPTINLNNNFTACTWLNVNSSATNIQTIFSNAVASISNGFKFYINTYTTTDKKICFETGDGTTIVNTATASNTISFNEWNHVCVSAIKSAAQVSIFLNGQQVLASGTTLGSYSTSGTLHFGQMMNNSWRFNGKMDEFSIWDTNLSSLEIKKIYERQSARYAGLVQSRVLDAFSPQTWTTLAATTTLPFYKELPGSSGSESSSQYSSLVGSTGSTSDNNLMSGLKGLWHLNETAGSTFSDFSGNGNHGTAYGNLVNTECTNLTALDNCSGDVGAFGRSVTFNGTTASAHYIGIPNSATLENIQETSSTYSIWFKQLKYQAGAIFVKQGYNLGFRQLNDGRVGFDIYSSSNAYTGVYTSAIRNGEWRNLTVTLDYSTGYIRLYLDGNLAQSGNIGVGYIMREYGANPWRVGTAVACSAGTAGYCLPASGSVDEIAIWNRVLDISEIKQLYRRGANRLKYQVRNCSNSDCSDQEALTSNYKGWKGPDNSGFTYFSELYNTNSNSLGGAVSVSSPTMTFSNFSGSGLAVSSTRYFQYRAIFESDDQNNLCNYGGGAVACSPELKSIGVGPTHYDSTVPTITSLSSIGSAFQTFDLNGFSVTMGGNACAHVAKYTLSRDGVTFYYWNGSAWTLSSDTYATASVSSDITNNITTFPTAIGVGTIQVKTFLKSDGLSPCEVDQLSFSGQKY